MLKHYTKSASSFCLADCCCLFVLRVVLHVVNFGQVLVIVKGFSLECNNTRKVNTWYITVLNEKTRPSCGLRIIFPSWGLVEGCLQVGSLQALPALCHDITRIMPGFDACRLPTCRHCRPFATTSPASCQQVPGSHACRLSNLQASALYYQAGCQPAGIATSLASGQQFPGFDACRLPTCKCPCRHLHALPAFATTSPASCQQFMMRVMLSWQRAGNACRLETCICRHQGHEMSGMSRGKGPAMPAGWQPAGIEAWHDAQVGNLKA